MQLDFLYFALQNFRLVVNFRYSYSWYLTNQHSMLEFKLTMLENYCAQIKKIIKQQRTAYGLFYHSFKKNFQFLCVVCNKVSFSHNIKSNLPYFLTVWY